MATRFRSTRSMATRHNSIKDENNPAIATSGNAYVDPKAASNAGGLGKPGAASQAAGIVKKAVLGVSSTNENAAAGGVRAGAKRPALGNISNAGGLRSGADPHLDPEAPSKATKIAAGHSRSRSTSAGLQDDATNLKAAVRPGRAVNKLVPSKSTSSVEISNTSAIQRPGSLTANRPGKSSSYQEGQSRLTGRRNEDRENVIDVDDEAEGGEDVAMQSDAGVSKISRGAAAMGDDDDYETVDGSELASLQPQTDDQIDMPATTVAEEIMEEDEEDWMALPAEQMLEAEQILTRVRETFEDEVDYHDTTMVAEYSDDIFLYMEQLEEIALPNPDYMDHQSEIEWPMRTTLIDWLLQVHLRYHMLPETLWIAVNIVDRFLSSRVVSLVKLQLVGVTAMFIAAKYEEILAPSVEEFVYMTENGYTKEEILKGERIILQTLNFEVSSYCSPYSWVRKISKADDYDIQTRTLSKFLMEVTLLDHRFLRAKPSYVAAVGMYLSRRMLDGDWNDAFIFYSNFTEAQLIPGAQLLIDDMNVEDFDTQYVVKKYQSKKMLRASTFACEWAKSHKVLSE